MKKILIIDDDKAICKVLTKLVNKLGHKAFSEHTLETGMTEALSNPYDVVLLDVHLPDGSGLGFVSEIREAPSAPEVVIVTGLGDEDSAELAIKSGAWDYIQKGDSPQKIILSLLRALQYREEKKKRMPQPNLKREQIIGSSPQLEACLDLLARAAGSEANVLIKGETGTGKELFANAIHLNSSRAHGRFVVVDCAALPATLVESILFGSEKGAFTGADKAKEGLVKQADRGTLFLDEVGELPLIVQKSFLRVLEGRKFLPVGAKKEVTVDFRLIAATNRALEKMVENGQFRRDLLFRLRTHEIELPSLRARKSDIEELTIFYLNALCEGTGKQTKSFSPDFIEALMAYDWPGNVRELFNTLQDVFSAAGNASILSPYDLPTYIRAKLARSSIAASSDRKDRFSSIGLIEEYGPENIPEIREFREFMERKYIERLMQITGGIKKEACRLSGLSRTRLFELIKKHNIQD
jgi:two-component system NtrC family response regulator